MKLHLTRDSVAAGDDIDAPHHRHLEVPDGASIETIVAAVAAARYLPPIQGGRATWSLASGRPLAVLAQQWPRPKMLVLTGRDAVMTLRRDGDTPRIHATYYAQLDPDLVLEVLSRLCGGAFD